MDDFRFQELLEAMENAVMRMKLSYREQDSDSVKRWRERLEANLEESRILIPED